MVYRYQQGGGRMSHTNCWLSLGLMLKSPTVQHDATHVDLQCQLCHRCRIQHSTMIRRRSFLIGKSSENIFFLMCALLKISLLSTTCACPKKKKINAFISVLIQALDEDTSFWGRRTKQHKGSLLTNPLFFCCWPIAHQF